MNRFLFTTVRAVVFGALRWLGLVLCALLFGACGSHVDAPAELAPDAACDDAHSDAGDVPADDADAAELERAAPDIDAAFKATMRAWDAAGLPTTDTNCPALYMVALRAQSDAQFLSGRFCSMAKGTDSRACYRPLEGELVFAPGATVDGRGEPVVSALIDGLSRCENVASVPRDVRTHVAELLAQ